MEPQILLNREGNQYVWAISFEQVAAFGHLAYASKEAAIRAARKAAEAMKNALELDPVVIEGPAKPQYLIDHPLLHPADPHEEGW